jgi:hypothetical protein
MTSMSGELVGKQLGILHDLLPKAGYFGVLSKKMRRSIVAHKQPLLRLAVQSRF